MTTHRVALLFLAAVALLSLQSATRASAHEPHPGLQFSLGIDGLRGCNTRLGDASCVVPQGSTFVVEVHLARLPDDVPSYGGFDLYLEHTGVTPLQDASNSVWPDCGFPVSFYDDSFLALGCAIGVPPAGPSTYAGTIGTNSFVCERSGSVTLVHSAGDKTDLVAFVTEGEKGYSRSIIHSEGAGVRETLNITCGEPPPPTPTASAAPVLPSTGQRASDGPLSPGWLMPSLLALGALGLSCIVLRLRLAAK